MITKSLRGQRLISTISQTLDICLLSNTASFRSTTKWSLLHDFDDVTVKPHFLCLATFKKLIKQNLIHTVYKPLDFMSISVITKWCSTIPCHFKFCFKVILLDHHSLCLFCTTLGTPIWAYFKHVLRIIFHFTSFVLYYYLENTCLHNKWMNWFDKANDIASTTSTFLVS